nr:glycosyltransferase family 2 protein [Maliibacterium massiliense]
MITISLCMIVRDEQAVIGRCLESVQDIVDEIIILDTGSKDRTKQIVKAYTPHCYDFTWIDDFAAARNASFDKATMTHIMWLDADDVLEQRDREGLRRLKQTLSPDIDVVMAPYNVSFDQNGHPTFTYYRERILKRAQHFQWVGAIHEVIAPQGNIVYSDDFSVNHKKLQQNDPDRNLRIFERMRTNGQPLDARQTFYYARELYYHARYEEAIKQFINFLEDTQGWVENKITACQDLARCYACIQDQEKALDALLRSLVYDVPRAEVCCDIGQYFMHRQAYKQAIFWYTLATSCTKGNVGFIQPDCYDYIPWMQLCVCYDRMGDAARASAYNEKAGTVKPDDTAVAYNRAYFQKKLLTQEEKRVE